MKAAEFQKIKLREHEGQMRVGVRPKLRGLEHRPMTGGFDIETCDGEPYILGLHAEAHEDVAEIRPGEGLPRLLRWAKQICGREPSLVLGAHNIRFDLGVLYADWCRANGHDYTVADEYTGDLEGGLFRFWIGAVSFATFQWGRHTIHFIDTFAYFRTSLVKAVGDLGLGETKADFAGRGEPEWYRKHFPLSEIGPYCLQDAKLAHLLIDQIVAWWLEFEIRPSISGPQMAGRVFCKEFVAAPWQPIPSEALVMSLLAYHGGRNIFIGEPGWYPWLRSYDVNSAYTSAMTQIPDMTHGVWSMGMGPLDPGTWGFVVLSGELPRLAYPLVYQDDFTPIPGGSIERLVITSMEWDLLRELVPGWQPTEFAWARWTPERDHPSDLSRYALTMWERRRASRTDVEKTLYKFLSNSLYGKFIARSPMPDGRTLAGELFYPPVAAWITALVRCRVIRAEFSHQVIHTATDGVLTTAEIPESLELGGFKLETEGPCLILRNKVYLMWNKDGVLKKAATHGFQGGVQMLLTMLRTGSRSYPRKRLRGWKEARRDQAIPFAPLDLEMTLHLPDAVWRRVLDDAGREPFRSLLEAR